MTCRVLIVAQCTMVPNDDYESAGRIWAVVELGKAIDEVDSIKIPNVSHKI